MARKKTAFDAYFDRRMAEPEFSGAYTQARAVIDSTDALVRALDEARLLGGMSQAELARLIEARPEVVRRLFTGPTSNPTLETVLRLASALGFHLELVPNVHSSKVPARAGDGQARLRPQHRDARRSPARRVRRRSTVARRWSSTRSTEARRRAGRSRSTTTKGASRARSTRSVKRRGSRTTRRDAARTRSSRRRTARGSRRWRRTRRTSTTTTTRTTT